MLFNRWLHAQQRSPGTESDEDGTRYPGDYPPIRFFLSRNPQIGNVIADGPPKGRSLWFIFLSQCFFCFFFGRMFLQSEFSVEEIDHPRNRVFFKGVNLQQTSPGTEKRGWRHMRSCHYGISTSNPNFLYYNILHVGQIRSSL